MTDKDLETLPYSSEAMTRAARKILAWAPEDSGLPHSGLAAGDESEVFHLPQDVADALQREASTRNMRLEAYVEEGLRRVIAGAEHLGAAKGQSISQVFIEMIHAEENPTQN